MEKLNRNKPKLLNRDAITQQARALSTHILDRLASSESIEDSSQDEYQQQQVRQIMTTWNMQGGQSWPTLAQYLQNNLPADCVVFLQECGELPSAVELVLLPTSSNSFQPSAVSREAMDLDEELSGSDATDEEMYSDGYNSDSGSDRMILDSDSSYSNDASSDDQSEAIPSTDEDSSPVTVYKWRIGSSRRGRDYYISYLHWVYEGKQKRRCHLAIVTPYRPIKALPLPHTAYRPVLAIKCNYKPAVGTSFPVLICNIHNYANQTKAANDLHQVFNQQLSPTLSTMNVQFFVLGGDFNTTLQNMANFANKNNLILYQPEGASHQGGEKLDYIVTNIPNLSNNNLLQSSEGFKGSDHLLLYTNLQGCFQGSPSHTDSFQ